MLGQKPQTHNAAFFDLLCIFVWALSKPKLHLWYSVGIKSNNCFETITSSLCWKKLFSQHSHCFRSTLVAVHIILYLKLTRVYFSLIRRVYSHRGVQLGHKVHCLLYCIYLDSLQSGFLPSDSSLHFMICHILSVTLSLSPSLIIMKYSIHTLIHTYNNSEWTSNPTINVLSVYLGRYDYSKAIHVNSKRNNKKKWFNR